MRYAFFFIFLSFSVYAEYSDTFVVKIFPQMIRVTSPEKHNSNLSVIIENKTMIKVLGKVVADNNSFEKFVTVKANKFVSIDLQMQKNRKFYFVPLSPPYQKIELKVGKSAYEIPAKK